jgi:prepilin-type N-terminal cleavage/methylation domain-containing protein
MPHHVRRRAFTLVELLVVIAIIGVLVALLLPAIQAARESSRRMKCGANLKQVATAVHNYLSAKKEFPAGSSYQRAETTPTWVVALFPYFEQQGVSAQYDFKKYANQAPNVTLAATAVIPILICPSDPNANEPILEFRRQGGGSRNPPIAHGLWYPGSMGPTIPDSCTFFPTPDKLRYSCLGCAFGTITPATGTTPEQARTPCGPIHQGGVNNTDTCAGIFCRRHIPTEERSVTDGMSNTFMAGETLPRHYVWNCVYCDNFPVASTHIPLNTMVGRDDGYAPEATANLDYPKSSGFKSEHPSGVNMVMADTSVHFISDSADYVTINMLGSKSQDDIPPELPY